MDYGRRPDIFHHVEDDLFHIAPVPVVFHQILDDERDLWHQELIGEARKHFSEPVLEVPDVRHIDDMGNLRTFTDTTWSEEQIPAVGVWHSVPTNGFLGLDVPSVRKLRSLIEARYRNAIRLVSGQAVKGSPWISESWIQFYKNGDYKVLHNHERYGPPYPDQRWAGSYYIDDGQPDKSMPYSGVFSFRIRQTNYYVRPVPGMLMMWPADILHEVHPFYGSGERVAVNFNINTASEG